MNADARPETLAPGALAPPPASSEAWSIEPLARGIGPRTRELWQYRRLGLFFGLKALQKLYKRTKLGWLWLFIRPLFPLLAKTLIFGSLLAVDAGGGVPYFVFLVTASTVWELFASATMWATRSLELNRSLLKQIYVPRLILPLSNMTPAFLTFAIYLAVLATAFVWFGISDRRLYLTAGNLGWAALAALMAIALAFSISLWTSVPALVARDVRFTVAYVLGFWIFLTPVMYPLSAVPPRWQGWMLLNPMAPIVEAFKFGLLGIGAVHPQHLAVSAGIILVVFSSGMVFFMRAEADAADRV